MTDSGDAVTGELRWFTSSFTYAGNNCVQVARAGGGNWAVRDSKRPDGGNLLFGRADWAAFLAGVKLGEYDR